MIDSHRVRTASSGAIVRAFVFFGILTAAGCGARQDDDFGMDPNYRRVSSRVLTAEDIRRDPTVTTVEELLERHFPGLYLRRRFEPGGSISVQMLGMGTPLFVVDGIPLSEGHESLGINPRDVETIEVWKHGNVALYGFRGSNGVVIITTKHQEF
jgi:TonB-dependent SusC/RagA subfamily outer membrane receptor